MNLLTTVITRDRLYLCGYLLLSTAQLLDPWSNWRQRNRVEGLRAAVGRGNVIRRHLINTSSSSSLTHLLTYLLTYWVKSSWLVTRTADLTKA